MTIRFFGHEFTLTHRRAQRLSLQALERRRNRRMQPPVPVPLGLRRNRRKGDVPYHALGLLGAAALGVVLAAMLVLG